MTRSGPADRQATFDELWQPAIAEATSGEPDVGTDQPEADTDTADAVVPFFPWRDEFTPDERELLEANDGFIVYVDENHATHACPTSKRPPGPLRVLAVRADADDPRVVSFLEMATVDTHPGVWVLKPKVAVPPPAPKRVLARPRTRSRERRDHGRRSSNRGATRGPPPDDPDEPEPASAGFPSDVDVGLRTGRPVWLLELQEAGS